MGSGGDRNPVVTCVDEVEVQIEVDGRIIGPQQDEVHERQEDIFMCCVESDPGRPGEVDKVGKREARGTVPFNPLHRYWCTGKK